MSYIELAECRFDDNSKISDTVKFVSQIPYLNNII